MSDERWERIKDLLHHAMRLSPEQRIRFLDESCPVGDPCRAEVESLLAADAEAPADFLLREPASRPPAAGAGFARVLQPGDVFEMRFRLLEILGEGGMGQVWLAQQLAPVQRQVAVKLVRTGLYDESAVQRFCSERQSLAIMDHPAIAKVFEAGTTAQGQPYFVMEYVPGPPITEYCDQHKLPIAARLELFVQACDGVQHAHLKGIAHRDLKPANILVVNVDGRPAPRIIDFGLAKSTAPTVLAENELTLLGQFVGTPGYMSPEQADPHAQDIDTRTDVYSLGVVLYVLLTGWRPFDVSGGKRPPLDVLLRRLREDDPPAPSAKVEADRESAITAAAARGMTPPQLVQRLRADLDWVALKALERDRDRRYGTPLDLAADLRRHLNNEPVTARPSSTLYRVNKYVRRHRIAVGVAAGLVALLITFSIIQGFELRRTTAERDRANQERDRANRERDRASRITEFMTRMFEVSDPSEARGNSVTAREILDKASADIGTGLAQDAEVQTQMLQVMASTYLNLGLYTRAHALSQRALDAREALYGPRDPNTLTSMSQLGWILDGEGHDAEAEKLETQALANARRVLGPAAPLTLETMDHLAVIEQEEGHYREAEDLSRQVMRDAARTLGATSNLALQSQAHVARTLWYEGRYPEAEAQYRQLMETERRVAGPDHPQTLSAMLGLAATLAVEHKTPGAEQLYRDVLTAQRSVLGAEHYNTALTMENLAALLTDTGRFSEAESLHRQVLAIRLRTLGAEHHDTLTSQSNLAYTLLEEGRVRDADRIQSETLSTQQRVLGAEDPITLFSQSNLAAIRIREGRFEEAERLARDTWSVQVRTLGAGHPDALDSLRFLGISMARRHRYAEAHRLFQSVIATLDERTPQGNPWSVWYAFACVASAAGRSNDALQYLHEAIHRGYEDAAGLMADEDLKGLRRNARFLALLGSLKTASPRT